MTARSTTRIVGDVVTVAWPVPALAVLYVVATGFSDGSPLRLLLSLGALLVLPGYALSLATFPLRTSSDRRGDSRFGGSWSFALRSDGNWELPSLGPIERWVVSLGFSVSLIPVYGLVLAVFGLSYSVVTILTVVAGLTSLFSLVALVQRLRLPDRISERKPGLPTTGGFVSEIATSTRRGTLVNWAVGLTFLVAAGGFGLTIAVPAEDPDYTSASLLTENETGALVASGYPHDLQPGEEARLVFSLTNHEDETVDYNVVVQSQQVAPEGDITRSRQVTEFSARVGDGATWIRPHQIAPQMPGDRVRVVYLVYRGSPPTEPTIENAYRSLTLWIREPKPGTTPQQAVTAPVTDARSHPVTSVDSATINYITG
jgi:uncharacterized membrane protein